MPLVDCSNLICCNPRTVSARDLALGSRILRRGNTGSLEVVAAEDEVDEDDEDDEEDEKDEEDEEEDSTADSTRVFFSNVRYWREVSCSRAEMVDANVSLEASIMDGVVLCFNPTVDAIVP